MVSSSFTMPIDTVTLQMALLGYQTERDKIQAKINELQRQLGSRAGRSATSLTEVPVKHGARRMSAAARKRIAAAQRKRWEAYRKKQKTA